jgi:hypothetical protein
MEPRILKITNVQQLITIFHMRSLPLYVPHWSRCSFIYDLNPLTGELDHIYFPFTIMHFTLLPRFFIRRVGWNCVRLVRGPLMGPLYQPQMLDEYGAVGIIRIGRGSCDTESKPLPVCERQIPHDPSLDRNGDAAMKSLGLMLQQWPSHLLCLCL